MAGYEFPNREWITLKEALEFWWSACFPNLPAPGEKSNPPIGSPGSKDDYAAFVPDRNITAAASNFDRKLSDAGFGKRVSFLGKRDVDVAEVLAREHIPFDYFSSPRGFCLGEGDIQPMSYPIDDRDMFECAVTGKVVVWHDVLVNRDEFLKWIEVDFPELYQSNIASLQSHRDTNVDATQISKTGAAGRPTAMHLVSQELQRRVENGEVPKGASAHKISRDLAEWYKNGPRKKQPKLPPIASDTIRKSLRAELRKVKSEAGQN